MFDWDDLKYFLEVSRRGRFTSAAQSLSVDHTTVSRRIDALERAVNAKLFDKTDRGFRLSESGEKLLPLAETIENAALRAQDNIAGGSSRLSGSVRIGAPEGFGSFFLAPRLPDLVTKHTGLDIELVALPRYLSLSKREADIGITLARPTSGRLYARKLTDYQLQLFASSNYLEEQGPISKKKGVTTSPADRLYRRFDFCARASLYGIGRQKLNRAVSQHESNRAASGRARRCRNCGAAPVHDPLRQAPDSGSARSNSPYSVAMVADSRRYPCVNQGARSSRFRHRYRSSRT